jgi:hypothetical protein
VSLKGDRKIVGTVQTVETDKRTKQKSRMCKRGETSKIYTIHVCKKKEVQSCRVPQLGVPKSRRKPTTNQSPDLSL